MGTTHIFLGITKRILDMADKTDKTEERKSEYEYSTNGAPAVTQTQSRTTSGSRTTSHTDTSGKSDSTGKSNSNTTGSSTTKKVLNPDAILTDEQVRKMAGPTFASLVLPRIQDDLDPEKIAAKKKNADFRRMMHEGVEALRIISDIGHSFAGGQAYKRDAPNYQQYEDEKARVDKAREDAVNRLYDAIKMDKAREDAIRQIGIANAYETVSTNTSQTETTSENHQTSSNTSDTTQKTNAWSTQNGVQASSGFGGKGSGSGKSGGVYNLVVKRNDNGYAQNNGLQLNGENAYNTFATTFSNYFRTTDQKDVKKDILARAKSFPSIKKYVESKDNTSDAIMTLLNDHTIDKNDKLYGERLAFLQDALGVIPEKNYNAMKTILKQMGVLKDYGYSGTKPKGEDNPGGGMTQEGFEQWTGKWINSGDDWLYKDE